MKRSILFVLLAISFNVFGFVNQPKDFVIMYSPSSKVTGTFDSIEYKAGVKCSELKSANSKLTIGDIEYRFVGISRGNADESCFDSIQSPGSELSAVRLVYSELETNTEVVIFVTAQNQTGLKPEFNYNLRFAQGVTARTMKVLSKY